MDTIRDTFFEGERPLFALTSTILQNVKFYPGESAMKKGHNLQAINCQFMGKYPFWHNTQLNIEACYFPTYGRAAIWYCNDVFMQNSKVEAPKMFRSVDGLTVKDSEFTDAGEFVWNCRNVRLDNVTFKNADYIFMNNKDMNISKMVLQGNYSFQDATDVVISDSVINSKDAFWNTRNVTVYDSEISGEYLGWYSENLKLVNCRISGSQPLCYATNLVLENCSMIDTDLSFEDSTVNATVTTAIDSVKNPMGGIIRAPHIRQVIYDEHCINPGSCEIIIE